MPKKHKEHRSAPGLGATYQAAKAGVAIGGPLVYQGLTDRSADGFKFRLTSHGYVKGVGVSLLDQYGSKKLGHAAALSRKSVTALIPEALAIADAAEGAQLDPVNTVAWANADFTGYDFTNNTFDTARMKPYLVTKYGLGIARKALNATRIAEPVKRFLGILGLAI